jgi:hypothetical protein
MWIVATTMVLWSLPGAASATNRAFAVVSSSHHGTNDNKLLGVAALSASEAWSVGYYQAGTCLCSHRTLAEHWNGTAWSIVPTPNAATGSGDYDSLQGTAALSPTDVWAAGYSGNASQDADRSLIERWQGTTWSIARSPNPYTSQDLYGIAAVSSDDVWAVGGFFNASPYGYGALIEHWNGTRWSVVPNPATTALYGVTALTDNDVWAVGGSQVLHWNGTAWSLVSSPPGDYYLRSATGVSAADVWAVGYQLIPSGEGYYYADLVEHWDGQSWSVVRDASPYPAYSNYLNGVAALSATSVWAVGTANGLSFAETWNGTRWTKVTSANVGTSNNTFEAAAANAGSVWAVGEWYRASSPYHARTLVEQCVGC